MKITIKSFVNLNLEVRDGSLEVWLWQSKTVAFSMIDMIITNSFGNSVDTL
jgi:hypothetical protein